jgi:hypothetical protein
MFGWTECGSRKEGWVSWMGEREREREEEENDKAQLPQIEKLRQMLLLNIISAPRLISSSYRYTFSAVFTRRKLVLFFLI